MSKQTSISAFVVKRPRSPSAKASPASKKAKATAAYSSLLQEPSWRVALGSEFTKRYFRSLEDRLSSASSSSTIFPPLPQIFTAYELTPLDSVRVVILGQDPYHGVGQAMGMAFSVQKGVRPPPSLKNMYQELKTDIPSFSIPSHGDLSAWASQGVFMLNTVLTVQAHKAHSHKNWGWEQFTMATLKAINSERKGVVFLLWGAPALKVASKVIDPKRHILLTAPHPSPLSAYRGFFGCRHFSKVNEILTAAGEKPIDWSLS